MIVENPPPPGIIELVSMKIQNEEQCYNPEPISRLIGRTSETPVQIGGREVKALVDTGSQISSITLTLALELGLVVSPLEKVLSIEGSGGCEVPYLGVTESKIYLDEVKGFSHEVVFLVVPDSPYGKICPLQLGTGVIDAVLEFLVARVGTKEPGPAGQAWKRAQVADLLVSKRSILDDDVQIPDHCTGRVLTNVQ